jgi:hypothetical protein
MYIEAARNAADVQAGNPQANSEADQVRRLFQKDAALSDEYNHTLLNGKWDHMMDQTHIGYTFWNEPPANAMPAVSWIQVPEAGSLGVSAEDATFKRSGGRLEFSLGTIDSVSDQTRTLTLFDRGKMPVEYTVLTSAPWIAASPGTGTVSGTPQQVVLRVDWSKMPTGSDSAQGTVTVSSGQERPTTYQLHALRLPITRANAQGFVESDGYVAIEAADTWQRMADDKTRWEELPDYGRTRSAMTVFPVTAESKTDSKAALEYRMYLYEAGEFQIAGSNCADIELCSGARPAICRFGR